MHFGERGKPAHLLQKLIDVGCMCAPESCRAARSTQYVSLRNRSATIPKRFLLESENVFVRCICDLYPTAAASGTEAVRREADARQM